MTLSREKFETYYKNSAKREQEELNYILLQAFPGTKSFSPESLVQLGRCLKERTAECGDLIADETAYTNDLIIIKKGECTIYKKKNCMEGFDVWLSSLDQNMR